MEKWPTTSIEVITDIPSAARVATRNNALPLNRATNTLLQSETTIAGRRFVRDHFFKSSGPTCSGGGQNKYEAG